VPLLLLLPLLLRLQWMLQLEQCEETLQMAQAMESLRQHEQKHSSQQQTRLEEGNPVERHQEVLHGKECLAHLQEQRFELYLRFGMKITSAATALQMEWARQLEPEKLLREEGSSQVCA
jgi:hypothetical protein